MAKEKMPRIIVVRLREAPTLTERLALCGIGMLGGMCALLGALVFMRAL